MTLAEILQRVCLAYGVTESDMVSPSRKRDVSQARAAFVYWARIKTAHSFPVIARRIRRDHTTAVHHFQTYPEKCRRYDDRNALPCMLAVNA